MHRIHDSDQETCRHLKPDVGYFEQVEIDYTPRCDGGTVPPALQAFMNHLMDSSSRGGKPLALNETRIQALQFQGFVNVKETIIRLPMSSWPASQHEKDLGRWHNLDLTEGLEGLSLGLFTRVFRWPELDSKRYASEMLHIMSNRANRLYNNL